MTQYSGKIIRKNPVTPTQQSASGVWTTAAAAAAVKNNNWPVAGVPNPISRSVRFRQSASAYFSRTPASASNRTTWTWSGWVKRGLIPTSTSANGSALFGAGTFGANAQFRAYLFDAGIGTNTACIYLQETVYGVSNQLVWYSTAVLRDPSAWYHIVVAIDTTQATSTNRIKVYLNGVALTGTFQTTPAQNQALSINNTVGHSTGAAISASAFEYLDGYLTEVNFIDGQQLTPSSFGTTNSITGAWIPMPYTGTYGTNGFYLNFKDNTSTTTIGYDYSGNSNNWTANNISLTAGVTYDSMVDVPTLWMPYNTAGDVGATVRGNYATLNPLQSAVAPSDGNLKITGATAHANSLGTINLPSTSKFYFEGFAPAIQRFAFGLAQRTMNLFADAGSSSVFSGIYGDSSLTRCWNNGTQLFTFSSIAANDVFQIAVDCATGKVWLGRNNTFYSSAGATTGDPVAGTNATFTLANITDYTSVLGVYDNASNSYINFGQRPFTYTPPTGFKTLNTFNLPAPTINNGASYMAATLYTGNGTSQSISNAVNGVSFQPDFVWIKVRSAAGTDHYLADAVRGATKFLQSDTTAAEGTNNGLTAFNSNGFSVGAIGDTNSNTATLVGWQWKEGATQGFDIVTYTGNGTSQNISHSLGVAPRLIIVKNRATVSNWCVWHGSFVTASNTDYLFLQTTGAKGGSGSLNFWNNTPPTDSVFTVGSDSNTNNSGQSNVAYLFAAVAGYSAFGSYTGNGSADGPFVFTGFRPRFVMVKGSSFASNWFIEDSARNGYNVNSGVALRPNLSNAEDGTTTYNIDILSNGFKIRSSAADSNTSGATFIYAAFAENPFKNSNAR